MHPRTHARSPTRLQKYHQQYLAKGGRFGNAQSAAKGCNGECARAGLEGRWARQRRG